MNNFNEQIRKFNRFELKYMLTLRQAQEIKSTLSNYMIPDDHGGQDNSYGVASLYYDSPNHRCYWEKENGVRVRRKLRIRHYEMGTLLTDETPVFLEIKQRVDKVTQKRRAMLPYFDTLQLCNERQLPESETEDRPVIKEAYVFIWQYNLIPSCIIRYDRQAYVGTIYDPGLRVTFDTDVTIQLHPLHLHEDRNNFRLLSPNNVIMEIKVNDQIPYWLTEMIAEKNLQLIRVSKYCKGIDAAWEMPCLHYRNLLAENVQEVLSSSYSVPVFWEKLYQSKENSIKKDH
jgi:hypothetical protein